MAIGVKGIVNHFFTPATLRNSRGLAILALQGDPFTRGGERRRCQVDSLWNATKWALGKNSNSKESISAYILRDFFARVFSICSFPLAGAWYGVIRARRREEPFMLSDYLSWNRRLVVLTRCQGRMTKNGN
jgi:hypothetical protein